MNEPRTLRTIADLADASGFSAHTLRYYERIGLLEPMERNESGHRVYDAYAVEWVVLLRNLRATGMPIRTMQEFASLVRNGEHTVPQRVQLLQDHRASILEQIDVLSEALERVNSKLAHYVVGDAPTPTRGDTQ